MRKVNRKKTMQRLESTRFLLEREPRFLEDEGAQEFWGEVQSVIDAVKRGQTDEEIRAAARWVGLTSYIVEESNA